MNYTPQQADGSIDISKALQVNTEFDLSRQVWAYLVKKGAIRDPQSFIHPVPHFSFVRGPENRNFLKKRFEALSSHPLYYGMEYSEDKKQIEEWLPLVMEGRDPGDVVTATRMVTGTDVDYGALTKDLLDSLRGKDGFSIHFFNRVQDLERDGDHVECARSGTKRAASTGTFKPSSFLSVPAADRCRCCKNPGFPKGAAMAGFQ